MTVKGKWFIAKVSGRVGVIAMVTVVAVTVVSNRDGQDNRQPNKKCHQ